MKLSQLETGKAFDVLAEITPYFMEMLQDKEVLSIFRKKIILPANMEEKDKEEFLYMEGMKKIGEIIPVILKRSKRPVFHIVAIINGKKYKEVESQNSIRTFKEIADLLYDKDLIDFLLSLIPSEKVNSLPILMKSEDQSL